MEVIKTENKLCIACMETHDVKTVIEFTKEYYKEHLVSFYGMYNFCDISDMLIETEEMIRLNSASIRKEYNLIQQINLG